MQSLFFWREWTQPNRLLWYILLGTFVLSLVFLWFSWVRENDNVIDWVKLQEQKIVETTVHNFRVGSFSLSVPAESYVIYEYLQGSDLHHNVTASYLFLVVFTLAAMALLAVFSSFERFWYFAAMGVFIVFVVSLRLEVLAIFGLTNYTVPISVMVLFVALTYYFKSFRPYTSLVIRFFSFLALAVLFAAVVYIFAESPLPFLHIAVASYIPALVLSILFILMVAHEIVVSFVFIASQGVSKSLGHFSLITLIYLVNVIITCLHETGFLHWDFIYINIYLLLTISTVLGLWGFKLRETLYDNIMSFAPIGAVFFIGLAIICFITTGHLLANANDAALKVVKDIIIFSHAGFGIIFFTYVFSNFFGMMASNLPVHKILYKPNRMPYFTFRLGGLIATLAFVFYMNWREYVYHATAGFYNYVGDLYIMQNNEAFGRSFYEQSRSHAFQNHRANYALATIKAARLDFEEAIKNYDLANGKRPSDFALVNKGNLYLWRKMHFPAIRAFRESAAIRQSPALSNNLGFTYASIHNVDSALYFINEARNSNDTRSSAEANFFALAAVEFLPIKTDSVLKLFESNDPTVMANAVAAATLFRQPLTLQEDPLKNEDLDLYSATYLNNYIIRNVKTLDTTFTNKALRIASLPGNFIFSEALKASLAYAFYHQANVTKALEILADLSYTTQDYRGKYNYVMGLWSMEQGNPGVAIEYFTHAVNADHKNARLYNAIALTELGYVEEALIAWDSVSTREFEGGKEMADQIRFILTLPASQARSLDDPRKYQYCRYRLTINDTTEFTQVVKTFEFPDYKAQALLDMAKKQYDAGRLIPAIRYFNQVSGLELVDKKLYEDIQHFELEMLASRNEIRTLATQINKGVSFEGHTLEKMLYTALISESNGDDSTAKSNYETLGKANPFFEEGIIAAAKYYIRTDSTATKGYDILAEAIQVNSNSIPLLRVYAQEAVRQGLDDYAVRAVEKIEELEATRE
jgi:tetratricopeptide (TPR) repeat protein